MHATNRTITNLTLVAALLLPAAAASGEDAPSVVSEVYRCRSIADDATRLACFDEAAAALEKAQTERKLTFGKENEFPRFEGSELASSLQAARTNNVGQWIFTLADGTRWLQTDRTEFRLDPKVGDKIVVRRSPLGNFRATTRGTSVQVRQIG